MDDGRETAVQSYIFFFSPVILLKIIL